MCVCDWISMLVECIPLHALSLYIAIGCFWIYDSTYKKYDLTTELWMTLYFCKYEVLQQMYFLKSHHFPQNVQEKSYHYWPILCFIKGSQFQPPLSMNDNQCRSADNLWAYDFMDMDMLFGVLTNLIDSIKIQWLNPIKDWLKILNGREDWLNVLLLSLKTSYKPLQALYKNNKKNHCEKGE